MVHVDIGHGGAVVLNQVGHDVGGAGGRLEAEFPVGEGQPLVLVFSKIWNSLASRISFSTG